MVRNCGGSSPLPRPSRQRGAALLLALLVMALATLLATRLLAAQDDFLGQVQSERDLRQARLLAEGGVDWARAVLLEDQRTTSVDHLGEAWARPVPAMEAEGGQVGGYLSDALARFNINDLLDDSNGVDRAMLNAYSRLLAGVGADTALAPRLADWMARSAAGQGERGLPGVRNYYSLADLAQVPGYTPDLLQRLRPHLVALPQRTAINVNTADAVVLAAAADLSPGEAARAVAARQAGWFRDTADFLSRLNVRDAGNGLLTTRSDFFLARVTAAYGDAKVALGALLRRRAGRVDLAAMEYGSE